jgi:peptidoglycan/LPS O-acetylase OafA/YrhL
LSLEEQFYLIWPCVLVLAGAKKSRWIAGGGAIACAGYRWMFWGYYDRLQFDLQSQVRADALLIGCLAALLLNDREIRSAAARWSKRLALPALIVLLYCIARFHWLPPLFESLAIAVLIAASTLHSTSIFARPLSFGPLTKLGVFSYSIYVWQAPFMGHWSIGLHLTLLCLGLPLVVMGSYSWIEKPLTQLGHRLTRKPNPVACESVNV